jgi:YidC/Oxa1 family membrane protein insertase
MWVWWQGLLDGLGWVLSWLFDLLGNYGVAIILITVAIRVILLPLGIRQIRSMHAMQALQPRMKQLQQKYKGNRQKLNEETVKLYREHGVNPLGGCWPMLLQIPVLAALYSVLQYPQHPPHLPCDQIAQVQVGDSGRVEAFCVDGGVRSRIEAQLFAHQPEVAAQFEGVDRGGTNFLALNLLCSAVEAGDTRTIRDGKEPQGDPRATLQKDCGSGIPTRIPYYVLALAMVGTTYWSSRQSMRANPSGASQQQQTLTRVLPLLFGVWGFLFPAGLVLYWTTSNLWQMGQQHFVLKAKREAEAEAVASARPGQRGKATVTPPPPRRGRPQARPATPTGRSASNRATPAKGTKRPQRPSGSDPAGTSDTSAAPPPASTPPRRGRFSQWLERTEQEQARKHGRGSQGSDGSGDGAGAGSSGQQAPSPGQQAPGSGSTSTGGGRQHARGRKKRRKR